MAQFEDIQIDRGSDVAIQLSLINTDKSVKDLTNYSANGTIRETYNSPDSDAIQFTAIIAGDATDGIVLLSLTNLQTDAMEPGRYVYDVEISFVDSDINTNIERVLQGILEVTPSVTRG